MTLITLRLVSALFVWTVAATAVGIRRGQIKNLVTFGDSYTDVVSTGDGGAAWPTYAAGYAKVDLFPFARSGATCSNNITSRPFPSLFESQLPLFFSERNAKNGTLRTLDLSKTLFTLWIGTNDIGVNSLLTNTNNATLVEVTQCMVNWVKVLYQNGARNFVFQNMIPLNEVPLYSANSHLTRFWTLPRNSTEWTLNMNELVLSGNMLTKLMLTQLAPTLNGAHIGLFDSHGLFTDMIAHPARYLNGTAPLNVVDSISTCVFQVNGSTGACTLINGTARDSFLWFDELHPSEQADRMVARQIADIITTGSNKWLTWLS